MGSFRFLRSYTKRLPLAPPTANVWPLSWKATEVNGDSVEIVLIRFSSLISKNVKVEAMEEQARRVGLTGLIARQVAEAFFGSISLNTFLFFLELISQTLNDHRFT